MLVSFLEATDVHYPGHSRAVAALADMITRKLGLADEERRNIHFAALLHDIGKVMVDAAVLRHKGLLGAEARARLAEHPALGIELLRPITLWEGILPAVHSHHERWDGKGYPRGLEGEQIPLGGAHHRGGRRLRRHDPEPPQAVPHGRGGPGRDRGLRGQPLRPAPGPAVRGRVPRSTATP